MTNPALGPRSERLLDRHQGAVMNTFGRPQLALERGEGAYVWDADGVRYLDLLAGIAVNSLGYAHPALMAAIGEQAERLVHVSNFFATAPQVELAERLLALAQAGRGSRVFFSNSGTEANEAALKMARKTGRPRVIALTGAFHGRTMGALALTAKQAYRDPFEPLPGGIEHVPFGDLAALKSAMADDVAAVFAEVIEGEAGVQPMPPGYLSEVRALTAHHGTLLVLDEVQTGIGRTGAWFAHQLPRFAGGGQADGVGTGVQPDIMTLAKGLGGGVPIGATIAFGERAASLLTPGDHGTTFGGNPLASAAALAVLTTIEKDDLIGQAAAKYELMGDRLAELADPRIMHVRGSGLLMGIQLSEPVANAAVRAAAAAGFIVNAPLPDTLRLAPPLIVTSEQLGGFVAALPAILDRATALADAGRETPAGEPPTQGPVEK